MANITIFVGINLSLMKHMLTVLFVLSCICTQVFAFNPDPANLSRKALGFEGNVSKAVLKNYDSPEKQVLKGTTTYVFNEQGEILTVRYDNASGTYSRLHFFQRDGEGALQRLTITENGKLDSYVVYGKGIEFLYGRGDYLVSITVDYAGERYMYDASEKDNYLSHPERYTSRSERHYDSCGRLVKEIVYTLGEEAQRTEYSYNVFGQIVRTVRYLDRELESVTEFTCDRSATLSVDASGQILCFTTIALEYFD